MRSATARTGRAAEESRFAAQLGWTLRRLNVTRMRMSLARVELPRDRREHAARLAEAIEDPCALAGLMADGSIVVAFFGPRPSGSVGDRAAGDRIKQQLDGAARRIAFCGLDDPQLGAALTLVHRWTDEVIDAQSMLLDLALCAEVGRGTGS